MIIIEIFRAIDWNRNGVIEFSEFSAACISLSLEDSTLLSACFDELDTVGLDNNLEWRWANRAERS